MKLKRVTIIMAIAIFVLSTVAGGFYYWRSASDMSVPTVESSDFERPVRTREFPPSLAELPQVSHVEGERAFAELEQLHGRRVPLVNAYILRYQCLDRYIKLWISVSATEAEASDLEAKMTAVLPRTGMYTAAQPIEVQGRIVYGTFDTHVKTINYYFASGPEVIWLETNLSAEEIEPRLPEVIEKY